MPPPASKVLWIVLVAALGWTATRADEAWPRGVKATPLPPPVGAGRTGFTHISHTDSGVAFTNVIRPERYLTNQIHLNGSGVAAGDIDGDGRCDLVFAGNAGQSACYRNLGGWKFTNATAAALGNLPASSTNPRLLDATGCALADVDGDGDLDLIVNSIAHGTHLYFNDGAGRFARELALNPDRAGMSLALADIDGDGDLDLYVANYRAVSMRDEPTGRFTIREENGRQRVVAYDGRSVTNADLVGRFSVTASGPQENGEPPAFFLNDGRGGFAPVSWSDGTFLDEAGERLSGPPYDWSLSVMMRDLTGDGLPDIYVCNDFQSPDRFWINETKPGGPLRLRAIPVLALRNTSAFSMGIDAADINRDGADDFVVVDMLSREHRRRNTQVSGVPPSRSLTGVYEDRTQFSHNTLMLGRGDGTFAEIARFAGLSASEWSWTPAFLDVDLDGFEDLLVSNGHELDMMDMDASERADALKAQRRLSAREQLELRRLFSRLDTPNAAFRNRGDLTFEDVSHAWNFDGPAGVSNGMCLADLDNDGDLDVVMNNLNGPAGLYRNDSAAPRIAVRLKGATANTHGIGSRLRMIGAIAPATVAAAPASPTFTQSQEMISGGRYLSSDDAIRVFACPAPGSPGALRLEVRWRSGKSTLIEGLAPNRLYEVEESAAPVAVTDAADSIAGKGVLLFEDVSSKLNHRHHEEPFSDRDRQPLLPHLLSQLGPGVTWADVDQDGFDDLLIGTGRGGSLAAFRNDTQSGFLPFTNAAFARPVARDLTTSLFTSGTVLAGSANYEDGRTNGGVLRIYDVARGVSGDSVLGHSFSAGPLAMADTDGDGIPETFVGGRAVAGRYPEAASSLLLKNVGGRFTVAQRFEQLGLVSGAVLTDLDGDGKPELALATEWGPVRVFSKREGEFREITRALGLAEFTGWWNGVNAGDFDEDGRMDLVAGNWGLNEFPLRHASTPIPQPLRRCYYPDLENRGAPDVIETWFDDAGREAPLRRFGSAGVALPSVRDRSKTYAAYGSSDLAGVYGDVLRQAPMIEARWLASTVFMNRGDHFEARPLPIEAQFAPAWATVVADFDGDGHEDLFLSQNAHGVHPEEARQDAGRGLLLLGDGGGGFRAVPGQDSGLRVYGEGRSAATADYDGDGRADLVVTQNGADTKLYRNRTARPGLRVRLEGSPANPSGLGASVRLRYGDKAGPWRELHGGAGYWSVDSPVMVLGKSSEPSAVEVRWPGTGPRLYPLPTGSQEVTLPLTGDLQRRK